MKQVLEHVPSRFLYPTNRGFTAVGEVQEERRGGQKIKIGENLVFLGPKV